MAILLSVMALLATFYQLYLQRIHNEKSLRPIGQIDLGDHPKQLCIHLHNKGLGPFVIDRLTFIKAGRHHTTIDECLDLDPTSYTHMAVSDAIKRVVLPNTYLMVFETHFDEHEGKAEMDHVRRQLSLITLNVQGRDIYDNVIVLERDFRWFSRYDLDNS